MSQIKLPKDWKWNSLSKVAKFHQGYGFPKDLQGNKMGEYPFYKVGDISKNVKAGNRNLVSCDNFIDENVLLKLKAKPYPVNTIVFAKIGEGLKLNRRGIIKTSGIVDNNAMGLKAIETICDDLFLYHFFNTVKLEDYSKATTVPSVRKSEIEEIQFPLPPLLTQQAIVSKIEELFSELDKGIEDLKTAQLQLKTYRQSVLKWAFEGKLTNENVKDGKLPKGWKYLKMSDIVSLSSLKHTPNQIENIFYIGLEHIEKHSGRLTSKVGKDKITTIKNKFSIGDILYGKLRPNLNKVYLSKEEGVCSTDILVLKLAKNCLGKYLHHIMISTPFVNEMSENTSGVNLPRVSTKFIMNYEIPMPPIEEQHLIVQEIESRLSVADKMEESIAQSLLQAEALRQSILKKAFSGELV